MTERRFIEGDIVRIEKEGPHYGRIGIVKQVLDPKATSLGWDYALSLDESGETYGFLDDEVDMF